jgi:hypothetical protein
MDWRQNKADKETIDSRCELDLQDLLLDVAVVVAATEPDRTRDGSAPRSHQCGVSSKSPPGWLTL